MRKISKNVEKTQQIIYIDDNTAQSFTCLLDFHCYVTKYFSNKWNCNLIYVFEDIMCLNITE